MFKITILILYTVPANLLLIWLSESWGKTVLTTAL